MSAWALVNFGLGFLEADQIKKESAAQAGALLEDAATLRNNVTTYRELGAFNAMKQSLEAKQVIGGVKVGYAAAGVEGASGSAMEVLRQSYRNAELDRLTILYEAEVQAIDAGNRANAAAAQARAVKRAGQTRGIAAVAGGVARGLAKIF